MLVVIASLHGAGKTRLAMDAAATYAQMKPGEVLLVDLAVGPSGIVSRCGWAPRPISKQVTHLSDLLLGTATRIPLWQGVCVAGMDPSCRALPAAQIIAWLQEQPHGLKIVDAPWLHELAPQVAAVADLVIVVAGPEDDWADGAWWLAAELRRKGRNVKLVLNQAAGLDSLAFRDILYDVALPRTDKSLGRQMLALMEVEYDEKAIDWRTRVRRALDWGS